MPAGRPRPSSAALDAIAASIFDLAEYFAAITITAANLDVMVYADTLTSRPRRID